MSNPYSDEFQNATRLIRILIDLGTEVLKECFQKIVANKNRFILKKSYADQKEIFDDILETSKKKQNGIKLFTEQNEKLTKGDIKKFDITLFFLVFKHFLNDSNILKYIKAIKDIRNACFAHIHHVGMESSELTLLDPNEEPQNAKDFPQKGLVKKLEYAFYCLIILTESDKKRQSDNIESLRNKIKNSILKPLDSKLVESYRDKISNLMAEDRLASDLILQKIEELNLIEVGTLIEEAKKHIENDFKKLNQSLKNILKILRNQNVGLTDQMISVSDHLDEIKESVDSSRSDIIENCDQNTDLIVSKIQESENRIRDEIKIITRKKYNHCTGINLNDFRNYFYNEDNILRYFKILVLDSNNLNEEKLDLNLLTVVANFDWNIVIDLNRKESSREFFCKNPKKEYMLKDLDELEMIPDIELIFNGQRLLYISSKNIGNCEYDLINPLRKFFGKFEFKRCVSEFQFISSIFLLNETYNKCQINKLNQMNRDFQCSIHHYCKTKKLEMIHVLFDDWENIQDEIKNVIDDGIEMIEKRILETSLNQFLTNFRPESLNNENDVILPGKDFEITYKAENEKTYGAFIEVYHKNIGNLGEDEKIDEKIEQIYFEKKLSFLKGKEIDPQTIYLNDVLKKSTYHETELIKRLNNNPTSPVRRKVDREVFFKEGVSLIIDITHEPGSGGTTAGRVLLFKYRERYPCFRIKNMDHSRYLIDILNKVHIESKLALILLIDSSDMKSIARNDVEKFSQNLSSNKRIKHLILFVQRSTENPKIKLRLEDSEVEFYEKLYREFLNEKRFNDSNMLFFKSLFTFKLIRLELNSKEDLKKKGILDDLIGKFCRDLDEKGRELVLLVYFNDKFSMNTFFNKNLTSLLLDTTLKDMTEFYEKNQNNEKLNSLKFFKFRKNQGFKPLDSDLFLKMINFIYADENSFKIFIEVFLKFINNIGAGHADLIEMTRSLLTKYMSGNEKKTKTIKNSDSDADDQEISDHDDSNSIDDDQSTKGFYSPLIHEYTIKFGTDKTKILLEKFYKLFETKKELSPYLGALWARYIFHNDAKNYEEKSKAVMIFRKAIGIKETFDCEIIPYYAKKSDLLCSYGDILRHFTSVKINEKLEYEEIIKTGEESLKVYCESQKQDEYNEIALIGECKIRFNILLYHFKNRCLKNNEPDPDIYLETLESSDTIIKESETKIGIQFDKLERLIYQKDLKWNSDLNKLYFDCKVQILKLRMNNVSISNLMKLPETYQIGLNHLMNMGKTRADQASFSKLNNFSSDIKNDDLIELIKRYYKQIETSTNFLSTSFRDLLTSLIILANKKHNYIKSKYDISTTILLAEKWKKNFYLEPEPCFFLGSLYFIKGIETEGSENLEYFEKARENFRACRKMYTKMNPAPRMFRWPVFVIGKNGGLLSLLRHDKNKDKNNIVSDYMEFEGEVVRDKKYDIEMDKLIVVFNKLKIQYLERNSLNPEDRLEEQEKDQKKKFKFHILIRRCDLLMYKFRRCDT